VAAGVIRVLLADDQRVVREGLGTLLGLLEGIELVGTAADGLEAIALAAEHDPDVVLMDLVLPEVDGVEAIRRIASERPNIRVIALTSFLDDDKLFPAVRAGAAGYLLKDVEPAELVKAIRTVHAGEGLVHPAVAARLMEEVAAAGGREARDSLTPRERQVVDLIARGLSNKRIALELGISEKTVKTHVSSILGKLGLTDRTQVALHAVREHWVE
jgi:two-component system, NarL family, response regulator LiaR